MRYRPKKEGRFCVFRRGFPLSDQGNVRSARSEACRMPGALDMTWPRCGDLAGLWARPEPCAAMLARWKTEEDPPSR